MLSSAQLLMVAAVVVFFRRTADLEILRLPVPCFSKLLWPAGGSRLACGSNVISVLMFLTAASASLFDSGLYGEESSCLMPLLLQKAEHSVLNCGPPSDLSVLGHPYSVNQVDSCPVTVAVSVHFSWCVHA